MINIIKAVLRTIMLAFELIGDIFSDWFGGCVLLPEAHLPPNEYQPTDLARLQLGPQTWEEWNERQYSYWRKK
jgi:hypothetical protein